jgi:hypothetical protein
MVGILATCKARGLSNVDIEIGSPVLEGVFKVDMPDDDTTMLIKYCNSE